MSVTASTGGAKALERLAGTALISAHLQAKSIRGKLISNFRVCLLRGLQILFQMACLLTQQDAAVLNRVPEQAPYPEWWQRCQKWGAVYAGGKSTGKSVPVTSLYLGI